MTKLGVHCEEMVSIFFTDAFSALLNCAWSLKSTGKKGGSSHLLHSSVGLISFFKAFFILGNGSAVPVRRPMMRFESGYTVETVFDGSKLGIEPYSVEVSPGGELLVLDSVNSNLYRILPSHLTCKSFQFFNDCESRFCFFFYQICFNLEGR